MALPVRRRHDDSPALAEADHWPSPGRGAWAELEQLQAQLSRALESFSRLPSLLDDGFTPSADVEETDDAYVVELELPGVKKPDVDISVGGRRLVVSGERRERERRGFLRHRTRSVGRFYYEVVLPGPVEEDDVGASLDEGVLTVRLPKPASDRRRRIPIT
ncbi:MAG TPA: Hsp20/alpha crystallin family protein [Acidimicrobiales bacterium]|nr:Hsp20/alpha crystallin family protein [Acidimicrobiales bacterium]